jgi:uncharacterized ParB-like nuclease family protein
MQMHSIRVEDIEIGERHRALSASSVASLAESMAQIGLRQPITVRIVDEMEVDGELCAGVPILVAGAHRLAAAKQLGWSHIDCAEIDDNAITAELWELAENLHRCDLTKEQRDRHIRRYAELLTQRAAAIVPQNAEQCKKVGRPKSVVTQVADAIGLSDDTVRRALNPPAPRTAVEIKMPVEAEAEHDAIIREANAIVSAWNRARQEAREMALSLIDGPVFDRSRAA